jgi:hypothetical protein
MRRLLVVLVAAAAVLTAAVVLGSCGTEAGTAAGTSPSPPLASTSADQPPAWLWKEAWRRAAEADGPVDSGYWGLLGDPEYGELMSSGPRDPSHPKVWVLVLIGRFAVVLPGGPVAAGVTPSPRGPADWVEYTYTEATHQGAGVFGAGWGEFDASPYPHLKPFDLLPPPDAGASWPIPPDWLRERALRYARNDQDPHPFWAGWGRMTIKQAATAVGLTTNDPGIDDAVVYLVILRGRFVDEHAFTPSGADAPRGGWLAFTVDAGTGQPRDYGIGDAPPPRPVLDRLSPLLF